MIKKSIIIKNWPKYLLQWGILLSLILFISRIIPSTESVDPEAYCPVGGLQAFTTFLVNGTLPCSMSSLQIMMGIVFAAAVVLFSKLFCGYLCPLGTIEELLIRLRKYLGVKSISIKNGSIMDSLLRILKYILLFWIFYMTVTASELFCKNLDPYYAMATGFRGEITLWMALLTMVLLFLGGFFINMFWSKYFCPFAAISNSLKFWVWIFFVFVLYYFLNFIGIAISWWLMLGSFCLLGYLLEILCKKNKFQLLYIMKDSDACNGCGLCNKKCPYSIDLKSASDGALYSVDCTLCSECVAICPESALRVGRTFLKKESMSCTTSSNRGKFLPAILVVLIVVGGIWFGNKFELPTIDETWNMETFLVNNSRSKGISSLQTFKMEGLKSVKCYGSSMALKARLQKVPGIYGLKTYTNHHYVIITYDPTVITTEEIQKAIYIPARYEIVAPDKMMSDTINVFTIRTEKMYDRMDIAYLAMLLKNTNRKIYGIASEFACPLLIRIYMDPFENVDEQWFRNIVESKSVTLPVTDGVTRDVQLNYKFVDMEDKVDRISISDFTRMMFVPYESEMKSRVEEYSGKMQFIYELANLTYSKKQVLESMPYLNSYLAKYEGFIGLYFELNNDLLPVVRIRYAAPMNAIELWELLTSKTWKVTYSEGEVHEIPAKLIFNEKGVEIPFNVHGVQ